MSTNGEMVRVPTAGEMQSTSFGGAALERRAETATTAMAAQAKASIEARYIVAMQRPRNIFQVRERLLNDCRRPAFAAKAEYNKPIGEGVTGPSIRLAEAAARAMGNILTDVSTIYDDSEKRVIRVVASDLESNTTYNKDVTVNKTIERSREIEGRKTLSKRINSRGKPVFVIEATDDEILDRENALASKAMRTCLLRLVPGDILDEALETARETLANRDAEDPGAARKAMADAFAALGVTVAHLEEYLGHALDQTSPKEMSAMRGLYNALKDGEASWTEVVENARAKAPGAAPAAAPSTPAPATPPAKPASLSDAVAASKAKRSEREPGADG